jgi:hypothetical protein
MDPQGEPPRLIEDEWVLNGAKKLDKISKPFFVALPMYELVIEYDDANNIIDPDASIPFDLLTEHADKMGTDTAGNPLAIFTSGKTVGDQSILPGTSFAHLKPHPGELTEIIKTLSAKGIENINGIALDGLPYEPSGIGHPASVYVASLKGASSSTGTGVSSLEQAEIIQDNIRAQFRAFWVITLFMLIAILLTGLSVWRKGKYTYDEDTGKLKRQGGKEG